MNVGTSIVLICATLCSLAAGLLIAYGVCLTLFRVFRFHALQRSMLRQVTLPAGAVRD